MRKLLLTAIAIVIATLALSTIDASADIPQGSWVDQDIVDLCEEIGMERHVSPELLEAIIETESAGQRFAFNEKYGCYGLMQINRSVHYKRMKALGVSDLYNARQNIMVGADLLVELYERFGDDTGLVLMAFNGVSRAQEKAAVGEYSSYAQKIMNRQRELERAHGKTE
jgi:soluble lytic murein transglycosylase-like protein